MLDSVVYIPVTVSGSRHVTPKIERMISDYANHLLLSLPKVSIPTHDTHWADQFCGIWSDNGMSAEEQVEMLRNSRSAIRKNPFE